jgi:hypothetical protein
MTPEKFASIGRRVKKELGLGGDAEDVLKKKSIEEELEDAGIVAVVSVGTAVALGLGLVGAVLVGIGLWKLRGAHADR